MTGGGAPGAAGILKCLQQEKLFHVIAADANPNAVGKYLADDFENIPLASDSTFIDALLAICVKRDINAILPLVTKELIPLAQAKERFEQVGVQVLVSSLQSLEIANNKSRLYEFLEWRGMAVPEYKVVETIEQFKEAATTLGYPNKPICFKPSVSNGSRGFRIIDEKADEWSLLFNQKPSATFINYNHALSILSQKTFPELLISEYLPGEEYSVDCLAHHGTSVLIMPRLRKKTINGITVEGEFVKDENIINYCKQIIQELQLHGNIGIQVKKSSNDAFFILEVNPRVQGTLSSALGAGVNLPTLAIKQGLNLPISADELIVKWGTKFSRYWEEVFY